MKSVLLDVCVRTTIVRSASNQKTNTMIIEKNKVRKGSLINFYGTDYTVDSVGSAKNDEIMDNVKVTMGNGIQINLWWTDREGCTVIKY